MISFMQLAYFSLEHLFASNIRLVLFSFFHAVLHHGGVAVDGNDGEGVSHLVLVIHDDFCPSCR